MRRYLTRIASSMRNGLDHVKATFWGKITLWLLPLYAIATILTTFQVDHALSLTPPAPLVLTRELNEQPTSLKVDLAPGPSMQLLVELRIKVRDLERRVAELEECPAFPVPEHQELPMTPSLLDLAPLIRTGPADE